MTYQNYLSESDVRAKVEERTDSITKIINAEDLLRQDVKSWDKVDIDLLENELYGNMGDSWTYPISHPYSNLIEDYAIDLFLQECTRIPFEHLNTEKFQGPEDAIIEGYWLNSLNYDEARELVYEWKEEIEFFYEYEQESRMFVDSCIIDTQVQELRE